MTYNKINFFQFNNLVQNKVSFLFLNLSSSVIDWFDILNKIHLRNIEQLIPSEDVIKNIQEQQLPKDFSIILLCEDGSISENLIQQLEEQGYTNAFYIEGGRKQMDKERLGSSV